MIRRVAAIVLAITLSHLNVVRVDAACASQGDTTTSVAHHSEHGHGVPHSAVQEANDGESCETPALPRCCQALVSCSVLLGALDEPSDVADARPRSQIAMTLEHAPPSRVAPPDPPPPRP